MLCNVLVVRYSMRKVNLAYLCDITSLLHTCTHAVLHVEKPISPRANINLQVTRHGHKILLRGIVYMMQDLAMEACYTIDENDYTTSITI